MNVDNAVLPTTEQMEGFSEPGPDGAIYMLNLLKFRAQADYEDGRESELSGFEAYAIYGLAVAELIREYAGDVKFSAGVSRIMVGSVEEPWDMVALAMYPSRQAMLDMITSEKYAEIGVHRSAGLSGQLNIETVGASGAWLSP
ncbi:MAG: DUF1330 domain-containing protein [Pseudomonadota bacterium]